jgi:hypothetical protein
LNDDVEAAFTNLKAALLNAPILFFPNFKYQLQLAVDASKSGIAEVLFQDIPFEKISNQESAHFTFKTMRIDPEGCYPVII